MLRVLWSAHPCRAVKGSAVENGRTRGGPVAREAASCPPAQASTRPRPTSRLALPSRPPELRVPGAMRTIAGRPRPARRALAHTPSPSLPQGEAHDVPATVWDLEFQLCHLVHQPPERLTDQGEQSGRPEPTVGCQAPRKLKSGPHSISGTAVSQV